jgi:hypothetical protein
LSVKEKQKAENRKQKFKMKHQYLAEGQDVEYVTADGKTVKAKITQVLNEDTARVEWDNGKHAAVAPHSDKKEANTFHFAEASAKAETTIEANKK